jgi:hypothetical protein
MHYLNLTYKARNTFGLSYSKLYDGCSIGACCGSDWFTDDYKHAQHRGIVVWPDTVEVNFKLNENKYTVEKITTKNGTFNVSVRTKL